MNQTSEPPGFEQNLAAADNKLAELAPPSKSQAPLEKVLGQREELYRAVLESLAEGLLVTDPESRIIYCNARLEEITGYTRAELLGAISYELLTPREKWPLMQKRLQERLAGQLSTFKCECVRKDGARHWLEWRVVPCRDGRGEMVGAVAAMSDMQRHQSLEWETEHLRNERRGELDMGRLAGSSLAQKKLRDQIATAAATSAHVLLIGDPGAGTQMVAQAIHDASGRRSKPFVRVDCPALAKDRFESEFFGQVEGAHSGGAPDRPGRFELAEGGTLFLDEIAEIPLEFQGKLLQALQDGRYQRIGEEHLRTANARLITATSRRAFVVANSSGFRRDLYYCLSVFDIDVPSLYERREDIRVLTEHFLQAAAIRLGIAAPKLTRRHIEQLAAHDWLANLRELQLVAERALISSRTGPLQFDFVQPAPKLELWFTDAPRTEAADVPGGPQTLRELKAEERNILARTLESTRGKIYGPDGAAALLGLKPTTLASKMRRHGLTSSRPHPRPRTVRRRVIPAKPAVFEPEENPLWL